jgi:ribonuclease HI
MENKIIIFTDGASKGNPGPGGYGVVIVYPEVLSKGLTDRQVVELGGHDKHTTNNRMELSGPVQAFMEILKRQEEVIIFTDSKYLINGMTGWIYGWQKNGWQTKEKKDVLNKDLWEKLFVLTKDKKIKWNYIGGHVGIVGNERCDEIASGLAVGEKIDFYRGTLSEYGKNILDLGHNQELKDLKQIKSKKSNIKAYSYLSLVDGVLKIDKTWSDCEKRVKGKKGAKYKKSISESDEKDIQKSWGVNV